MQKLAFEFPEVTFMAFDSFWSYERSAETLHLAAHTPNVSGTRAARWAST